MNSLLGLLVIVAACWLYFWLRGQWDEWKGALTRWRIGDPLRSSEASKLRYEKARKELAAQRQHMRSAYELSPSKILDSEFRQRFIELGVAAEIRGEVIAKHQNVCAICKRKIRTSLDVCIDHIKPMKYHPQLEFWITNLQVLCRSCNSHKSAYDGWDWEEVTIERKRITLRKKRRKARLANPSDDVQVHQDLT